MVHGPFDTFTSEERRSLPFLVGEAETDLKYLGAERARRHWNACLGHAVGSDRRLTHEMVRYAQGKTARVNSPRSVRLQRHQLDLLQAFENVLASGRASPQVEDQVAADLIPMVGFALLAGRL